MANDSKVIICKILYVFFLDHPVSPNFWYLKSSDILTFYWEP